MNAIVQYAAATILTAPWVERIHGVWQQSVKAVIETGRLITEAKAALPHGEFLPMIQLQLPFSASTAQRLMAIAADERILHGVQHLPASWGTLYELTKLDDEQFESRIEDGTINPDMERKDVVRPNGARSIMSSRQEPDDSLDYFPTPPWATRALMERVLPQLGYQPTQPDQWTAWEPASGAGHMAEVLREYFSDVTTTDIHDYGYADDEHDFLAENATFDPGADWIITNPPFGLKAEAFVLRALGLARIGVAMLFRLQWLETEGRCERIFIPHPPTMIAFFAERVGIWKGRWEPDGGTATAYIWLVWDKTRREPLAPYWIPPGQREALTRPDDAERFTAHPVIRREALPAHDPYTGEITETASAPRCRRARAETRQDALHGLARSNCRCV